MGNKLSILMYALGGICVFVWCVLPEIKKRCRRKGVKDAKINNISAKPRMSIFGIPIMRRR